MIHHTLKVLSLSGLLFLLTQSATAQKETIQIKTSAVCDMCKTTIENELNYTKGVRFAKLDVETKVITVTYNAKKTNPKKIKEVISMIGYDADDVLANTEAQNVLHTCCKPTKNY